MQLEHLLRHKSQTQFLPGLYSDRDEAELLLLLLPQMFCFRGRRQGRQPLNPARGPRAPTGRVTAVGSPPPKVVNGRGASPAADPRKILRFTAFLGFPMFSIFWLQMAQDGPT